MKYNPKKQELDLIDSVARISLELREQGHTYITATDNGNGGIRIQSVSPDGKPRSTEVAADGNIADQNDWLQKTIALTGSVQKSIRDLEENLKAPPIPEDMNEGGNLYETGVSALLYLEALKAVMEMGSNGE